MSARENVHNRMIFSPVKEGSPSNSDLLTTLCAEERAKALKEVWDRTQGEQMPMGFLAWLAVNAEKPR